MKSRKVVVTIEMETDIPLTFLRNKDYILFSIDSESFEEPKIIQVQANVIKKEV